MTVKLVCPECGSDDIRQLGSVEASWGGSAVVINGEREWGDDMMGAEMYWDAYEVDSYGCQACDHQMKTLDELKEEDDDDQ